MEGGFQTNDERPLGFWQKGGFWLDWSRDSHSYYGHSAVLMFYTAIGSSKRQSMTKFESQVQNHG